MTILFFAAKMQVKVNGNTDRERSLFAVAANLKFCLQKHDIYKALRETNR